MIGDGRTGLTDLTPGSQTWIAQMKSNFVALNDQHAGRVKMSSGEALITLELVALDLDGLCYKADSNDAGLEKRNALGITLSDASGSGEAIIVQLRGEVLWASHGFTVGSQLFVSETPGQITETPPTTPRIIGIVLDANRIWIDCPMSWAQS